MTKDARHSENKPKPRAARADIVFGDSTHDRAVVEVADEILRLDPDGERFATVMRSTFDQLYDGQRTGRYRIEDLSKTEKTHFGSVVEINLAREFQFPSGEKLDFLIAGHEVDCKYSGTQAWMLPPEVFDEIALLVHADDLKSSWSAGVVRVTQERRTQGQNRDRKSQLSAFGKSEITWLFREAPMQPNVLLQLPKLTTDRIFSHRSGQARVNELFRLATNLRISRNIVATVAQQSDYMKRVRANGGSRTLLRPEGILILSGDYSQQVKIAEQLGSVSPEPGELVSVRVVPSDDGSGAVIQGSRWRMARADDSHHEAPLLS